MVVQPLGGGVQGFAEPFEAGPDEPVTAFEEVGDDPVAGRVVDGQELVQVGG
jgi:hypothetical protein